MGDVTKMKLNLRQKASVVITGTVAATGEEVAQTVGIEHDAGCPVANLIGEAFKLLRQTGGILVDRNEEMDYYPLVALRRINFKVNAVALARAAVTNFTVPA